MSSKSPPESVVYFIDRSLGRHLIANALRGAGVRVEVHDDHFPQDAADEVWIERVGAAGWLAVTKDRNIRYRTAEIEAVKRHGARVLVLRAKNATGTELADLLVATRERIERYVGRNEAPFVAGIDRAGRIITYEI